MEGEVNASTVNLAVSATELTAKALVRGLRKAISGYMKLMKNQHGEIPLRKLLGKDQGAISIPIEKTEVAGFRKYAQKYNVDFSIKKDKVTGRYNVFFEAHNVDAINSALKDYAAEVMKRERRAARPSILTKLHNLVEKFKQIPNRERQKEQVL